MIIIYINWCPILNTCKRTRKINNSSKMTLYVCKREDFPNDYISGFVCIWNLLGNGWRLHGGNKSTEKGSRNAQVRTE